MVIPEIIGLLKSTWGEPAHAMHEDQKMPFRLSCSFAEGLQGLPEDYPYNVPAEVKAFWEIASTAKLFKDVDYGQWGLEILSPEESVSCTKSAREYGSPLRTDELIIGKFLGDPDVLIVSCGDEDEYGSIRIGLPIDPYPQWPVVAKNFQEFLEKYVKMEGDKYWEIYNGKN